jgi:hypothetical protein
VWWLTSVIPTLGRLRQKHHEDEVSLRYTVRPYLKKKKSKPQPKQKMSEDWD